MKIQCLNRKYKLIFKTFILVFFSLINGYLNAQNPFLPATAFIPDGEPHVFEFKGQNRVFIYGSRDEVVTGFCGYGHDVWSAPVNNLTEWTNHGEIFNVKQVMDIGYGIKEGQVFGAPDCVYNPVTKKYYLYTFFLKNYKMDGKEGPLPGSTKYIEGFGENGPVCVMAVSDSPVGPFLDPVICDWPSGNNSGAFDPSVLVDEQFDGTVRVYGYWGAKYGDRWAEIDPYDMHTIINPKTKKPLIDRKTKRIDRNVAYKTLNNPFLNEYSTLFEASSIKKIAQDKYVFVYSSNERLCALSYCYSNSPEGPWNYGGKIIDNGKDWAFGNNHGSIFQVEGKWYVVYHKETKNGFNRQAMMEPIQLFIEGEKVVIPEVEMTSQGLFIEGLNAFRRYNINTMCYRTNSAYVDGSQRNTDGLNPLVGINQKNTVIGFKYLNFGKAKIVDSDNLQLKLNVMMVDPDASITLQIVPKSDVNDASKRVNLGTFKLKDFLKIDETYHNVSLPLVGLDNNKDLNAIGGLKGQLAFFLLFNDNIREACRLKEFEFSKGNASTPNPLRPVIIKEKIKGGKVTALPVCGRGGESIKLSIVPEKGYKLKTILVKDKKGRIVDVSQNENAPYALLSFNFKMPEQEVLVTPLFIHLN